MIDGGIFSFSFIFLREVGFLDRYMGWINHMNGNDWMDNMKDGPFTAM